MLTLEQAQGAIVSALTPLDAETVALDQALGRISGATIAARRTLPPFDNSAMDGYAVRSTDLHGATRERAVTLSLVGQIPAGGLVGAALEGGQCMRIFTGAALPPGADAVVMQEHVEPEGDNGVERVSFFEPAVPGQHVRRAGEDVTEQDALIGTGQCLRPGDIGMLAAQGISWVRVARIPRVAIVSTGDELVEIDEPLGPGQIVNSNAHLLAAQIRQAGAHPHRLPTVPDDPEALARALSEAARCADLVVTCAGVSVGDFDYVREVLERDGHIEFWRVAIKPGKPVAFGRWEGIPLIGLPGNPASAFVTFELFVGPAIRRLGRRRGLTPPRLLVTLAVDHIPHPTRRELARARIERRKDGVLWGTPLRQQGSGQLSSMLDVHALLDIPPGSTPLAEGTRLEAWLLAPDALVGTESW